jgi:hypothetical protein
MHLSADKMQVLNMLSEAVAALQCIALDVPSLGVQPTEGRTRAELQRASAACKGEAAKGAAPDN